MKAYYDLHIHSCLSPCGDNDSTPANILGMAHLKGLSVIAVSDHNSMGNVLAAIEASKEYGILVMPAMEVTTCEEIHVLCLFDDVERAQEFEKIVRDNFMGFPNDESIFGEQLYVDSQDIIVGREGVLLISATNLSLENVRELTVSLGGLPVLAHVDKDTTSVTSVLGGVFDELLYTVVELSKNAPSDYVEKNPHLKSYAILKNSDAHYLWDISECENYVEVEELTRHSVLNAIKNMSKFNF